jgi:hypothetical protein
MKENASIRWYPEFNWNDMTNAVHLAPPQSITDQWCTYNEHDDCQYVKSGPVTVDKTAFPALTGGTLCTAPLAYWEGETDQIGTSILYGEKIINIPGEINNYNILAKLAIDDESEIYVKKPGTSAFVKVPALSIRCTGGCDPALNPNCCPLRTPYTDISPYFGRGDNIVRFKAIDYWGLDSWGGCGGREFNMDWNITRKFYMPSTLPSCESGNLALNKAVIVSHGSHDYGRWPEYGNDGNINSFYDTGGRTTPEWFVVDFGEVKKLNVINYQWESWNDRIFALQYFDGTNWIPFPGFATLQRGYEQSFQKYTLETATYSDRIRFYTEHRTGATWSTSFIWLYELQAYCDSSPPIVNVVSSAPAGTASSTSISFGCSDAESNCKDSSRQYTILPSAPFQNDCAYATGYQSYTSPITLEENKWICMKGSNNVGIEVYSVPYNWYPQPCEGQDTDYDQYSTSANDYNRLCCRGGTARCLSGVDCNNNDLAIRPGATESCDNIDQNCNGMADEPYITYYQDSDGDNYGNINVLQRACSQPVGYVTNNQDCNDGNAAIKPGVTEVCDGVDNNCVNGVDEGFEPDNCQGRCQFLGKTWAAKGGNYNCCGDDANEDSPYQAIETSCSDGNDNDCNGLIDSADPGCDLTPPVTTINSPASGTWQSQDFNFCFTPSDNVGISSCSVILKDEATDKPIPVTCSNNQQKCIVISVGAGKNCSKEGAGKCIISVSANDTAKNAEAMHGITLSIGYSGPEIKFEPNGFEWATSNIQFNISCNDINSCTNLNYSYLSFDYASKKYDYTKGFIFARGITGNNVSDNVSCSVGETCTTIIKAESIDGRSLTSNMQSSEFGIDLQTPSLEKTECRYKSKPASNSVLCSTGQIILGSSVTILAVANDSRGSGIKNFNIYLKKGEASPVLLQSTVKDMGNKRKNATASIIITDMESYDTEIEIEDEVGNKARVPGVQFIAGGDPTKNCSSQSGTICNFYQICSGISGSASDAHENLGITCCFIGQCMNRSTLATCKLQNGEIYDNKLSSCVDGVDVPSSDTIEKNKCCKGGIVTARSNTESLAWYDMSGNKLTGAARGDKVRCIGLKDTTNPEAYYNITIKLGNEIKFGPKRLNVSKTLKAESDPIVLKDIGTYRCEATLVASPPKKMIATLDVETRKLGFFELLFKLNPLTGFAIAPANLKVIEAPVKPRYTELPGFSLISLLISISGLLVYYLKNNQMNK